MGVWVREELGVLVCVVRAGVCGAVSDGEG